MASDDPAAAGQAAPTHLVGAILAMCLCFLPLGVIAVAFAWRAATLNRAGEWTRATRASRAALGWIIATIVIGVIVDLILASALGLLGAFGS